MKAKRTDSERILKLEKDLSVSNGRILQCERALRIMGGEFKATHLSEEKARRWAVRLNSLSNALREVGRNLQDHGNQFDKEPHMVD